MLLRADRQRDKLALLVSARQWEGKSTSAAKVLAGDGLFATAWAAPIVHGVIG